jgi:hypothetical protein
LSSRFRRYARLLATDSGRLGAGELAESLRISPAAVSGPVRYLAALGETTPAGTRMAETLAFFEFVSEEMPAMLERWRERRDKLRASEFSPPRLSPGRDLDRTVSD